MAPGQEAANFYRMGDGAGPASLMTAIFERVIAKRGHSAPIWLQVRRLRILRMGDGAGFLRVAHEPFHSERRVDPQLTQKVQAS